MADETAGHAPVAVKAEIDTQSVSIGDKIKYTIEVKAAKDIEVKFPDFGENLAEFAIRDFGSSTGGFFGSRTLTQWYVLDIYETGTFTIPEALIKYRKSNTKEWQEVLTAPIEVDVLSVLDSNAEEGEIRDIKGPVSLFNPVYVYILLSVMAAILIAALVFFLIKRRKKIKEAPAPLRPAHEIAYEALKVLMKTDYPGKGKVQEYYFELSNIVRHYIENRFYLKAPEMTTEEFLAALKNSEVLTSEQKGLVREFLSHCDMVKFAKYLPEEKEMTTSYYSAKKLVDQTKEIMGSNDAGITHKHL
jgi:hypothetical protein